MRVLRVRKWKDHFENNRTRELKDMTWVPIPNKLDGDGYTQLVGHPDGAAHFGAWIAIVEVASKCSPRGTLVRGSGQAHDSSSLSRITRIASNVYDGAIPRLLEIGWLETQDLAERQDTTEPTEIPHADATPPQEGASSRTRGRAHAERNGTEANGMEGNDNEREDRTVVAVLLGEGFQNEDPILSDPNCTAEQVAIAIANADAYPVGKLTDRRGYIAQAIRKGYTLSAKANRAMKANQRRAEINAAREADADGQRKLKEEAEEAKRVVMGLDDKTFLELAETVLGENPKVRGFVKAEKTQPWMQLHILRLMRREEAHAAACA